MPTRSIKQELLFLLSWFIISRVIIKLLGVSFGYNALYEYWQYLDIKSLSSNLFKSLWYLHSQPPVFNLLLGMVLKLGGDKAGIIMEFLLLAVSCCNAVLLLLILRKIIVNSNIPVVISLFYLLSPATMLFENELFYTTFISMFLLASVYYIILFHENQKWKYAAGIFISLSLVCLTRSMYHLLWLLIIPFLLASTSRKQAGNRKIIVAGLLSLLIVGGWYEKNYLLFDSFSASSWFGINFSRIVFHKVEMPDSTNIAAVHPFMPIYYYRNYISNDYQKKYAGLQDVILLAPTKNTGYINMNNAGYLQVSKEYMESSVAQVKQHPLSYIKNALIAFGIYFTPASSYFKVAGNDLKIRYYDMVYSINPALFFTSQYEKKKSLVIAAIPKFVLYVMVSFILLKFRKKNKALAGMNLFISFTILFSMFAGSMFDYGENMRFRYEIEPLFLILAAQAIYLVRNRPKEDKIVQPPQPVIL